MYIAMNKFWTKPGKEKDFETVWKERESHLKGVPGFKEFRLLRGEGGVYISHSAWESEKAFIDWTESEAFQAAHRNGGSKGLVQGPPEFNGYQVVLSEGV
jgi:heme-degrading monooxygenase HmoA